MIVSGALGQNKPTAPPSRLESVPDQGGSTYAGRVQTKARQHVSPELAKKLATVFRCMNGISDDIAGMPVQQFRRESGKIEKIDPDGVIRNVSYLLEIAANRWMTPFVLKKTAVLWLLSWGNALIWQPPPPAPREFFILPTNMTVPKLDPSGNLWYEVRFPNGEKRFIPAVEVMHVMINSTNGIWGRSVLEYARETVGLRMGMSETQSLIHAQGLNMSAYMQVSGSLDKEGREKVREAYSEAITGSDNVGRLAVFDNKVVKFEPLTMKFSDAQFLELMEHTDRDIANFFKYPEYKLNMGKQSYESNEQQDLDYLKSTLDPHLVQWEQAARLRWLSEAEQKNHYFKFIRESVLRTNAKTRAELHEIEIRSGMLMPNEGREHEDRNSYPEGNKFWMTRNNAEIGVPENAEA
ncbi:MAG: phage portal protein [Anaerolineae bacterium]|nr:phage portal protein [Anaerolineae bacterium]